MFRSPTARRLSRRSCLANGAGTARTGSSRVSAERPGGRKLHQTSIEGQSRSRESLPRRDCPARAVALVCAGRPRNSSVPCTPAVQSVGLTSRERRLQLVRTRGRGSLVSCRFSRSCLVSLSVNESVPCGPPFQPSSSGLVAKGSSLDKCLHSPRNLNFTPGADPSIRATLAPLRLS